MFRPQLLVPLFLLLLIVRGAPVWLYRAALAPGERMPFVLVHEHGTADHDRGEPLRSRDRAHVHRRAAALVGAGIISVLVFPALALQRGRSERAAMESTDSYDL
jgi:hypothetical protein